MTEEDLSKMYYLHYAAAENAMLYGTGFIKIAMVNGKIEGSVVSPNDYRYIEPIELEKE